MQKQPNSNAYTLWTTYSQISYLAEGLWIIVSLQELTRDKTYRRWQSTKGAYIFKNLLEKCSFSDDSDIMQGM